MRLLEDSRTAIYDLPGQSLALASEAYDLANAMENDSLKAAALNRIGNAHWSIGNQMKAIEFLQSSLQISEVAGFEELVAKNYGNIGNVYNAVGFNLDAINYYKLELGIQENYQRQRRLFAIYNNIAMAYFNLNRYDSTHYYLDKARERMNDDFVHLSPILYANMAEAYLAQGNLLLADSLLDLTYETSKQYDIKRTTLIANQLKAELERKKGEPAHALEHALVAKKMAIEMGIKDLIYVTSQTLAGCYGDLGMYDQAYINQMDYEIYRDSVQNSRVRNELELLSYYQRLFRMRVLESRNELNFQLAEQRQFIIQGLVVVLIISAILLGIIFFFAMKNRRQKRQLENLNAFKSKIFAIVSHDLKSPIQSVSSVIEMFNEKLLSKEDIEPVIPEVKEKTSNLISLLNNIFLWAEGQMEGENFKRDTFLINEVLDDLFEELKDRLNTKGIVLEYDRVPSQICSNKGIVRILLRNLLVNAIKFSHSNSVIKVNVMDQENYKVIEVIDEGIGINSSIKEGLFTGGLTTTDGTAGEKGNGLGLALCSDFVKGLGGAIEVESEEGKGSTFRVFLKDAAVEQ